MAELFIHTDRIRSNVEKLSAYFQVRGVQWSLVTKVFSGDLDFLQAILTEETVSGIHSVGDSRLTSLKNLKQVYPGLRTIYIKPPAKMYADEIVRFADVSLNSSATTIRALNQAALDQETQHKVIIMVEQGELREGVTVENLFGVFSQVHALPHIQIIGIGSNLGCMYGIEPSPEKFAQLMQVRGELERKFKVDIPYISAGTSISLPLLASGVVPQAINHFRIGEAVFFGLSPLKNEPFEDLHTETFEFHANIIELETKEVVPEGVISDSNIGHTVDFNQEDAGETSVKAILDFGMLDVDKNDLDTTEPGISFVGITSDMIVVDLGSNKQADGSQRYRVGDVMVFKPNYMAVARLLNSKFIDKQFLGVPQAI